MKAKHAIWLLIALLLTITSTPLFAMADSGVPFAFATLAPEETIAALKTPEEAETYLAQVHDAILFADEAAAVCEMTALALDEGVQLLIHYSFPRHQATGLIQERQVLLHAACKKEGIAYEERSAPDPTSAAGLNASLQSIQDDMLLALHEHKGKKIAFIATHPALQEAISTFAKENKNAFTPLQSAME